MQSPQKLIDVLKRDGNNFDMLRLIAALGVIIGHAYAIAPQPPLQDGVLSILHFDYSGSLAVKFFFFLSGMLVTNSIIAKPDPFHFLIKRACRIFPGLFLCLLVAVFIVGPLFTKLSLADYFSDAGTWKYIFKNFTLYNMIWRLPGVFTGSQFGLNGSLWTLPCEVICYIYLAVFFGLGLLRNKIVSSLFFSSIVAVAFIVPGYLPEFFSRNPEAHLLPACFAIGALFSNNKSSIPVNSSQTVLIWLLVILVRDSSVYQFVFYVAFFYTTVFISSLRFVKAYLKLPFDASYGVYVYGFMIQQCVYASFPGLGLHGNQFLTSIIAVAAGIFSWYFIEKRFIAFGNKVVTIDSRTWPKGKITATLTDAGSRWRNRKDTMAGNIFVFCFLTILALIIHALVLKFVFPGYYSPLYPQHSDFYRPAAYAHSPGGFTRLLSWPRPVNMIFSKCIGYFGIKGSIGCVIILVCMNCALSAILIRKFLRASLNWMMITLFAAYCYLLFSQPYFYIFYVQDIGAQLSYFFLVLGLYCFYVTFLHRPVIAGSLLFCCCLLAFLSKETYGLAALLFSLLWYFYYRKRSSRTALLPVVATGLALLIAVADAFLARETSVRFIDPGAAATDPYHISLSPRLVMHEWFLYAREGLNIADVLILLLLAFLIFRYKGDRRDELLFITTGCILGGILSWLPNAILPNHHYKGYSFNGANLLYLPLLFLPILGLAKKSARGAALFLLLVCFISPVFNRNKYKDNDWVLFEENTQRNLLKALFPLMNDIHPSERPQKILIQGVTFPFHPFSFPQSLRVFPNAANATFDVVDYGPAIPSGKRTDLVKFISPADAAATIYEQRWVFNNEGKLVAKTNVTAEKIFDNPADSNKILDVGGKNFSQFTSSGFYEPEQGLRWIDGNATIDLNIGIGNTDSLVVRLNTYMPPVCKNIVPRISLSDINGKTYTAALSERKEDVFYYLFIVHRQNNIRKITISSETIDSGPDKRILSFPFISLEIRK